MQSQRFHISILFEILTFEVVMLSGHNRINTIREVIKFDRTIVYLTIRYKTVVCSFWLPVQPQTGLDEAIKGLGIT